MRSKINLLMWTWSLLIASETRFLFGMAIYDRICELVLDFISDL